MTLALRQLLKMTGLLFLTEAVFEKLGYTVEWNDRRITAKNKDTEMILAVGSSLVQISKNERGLLLLIAAIKWDIEETTEPMCR